jgi:hypothetical protein
MREELKLQRRRQVEAIEKEIKVLT